MPAHLQVTEACFRLMIFSPRHSARMARSILVTGGYGRLNVGSTLALSRMWSVLPDQPTALNSQGNPVLVERSVRFASESRIVGLVMPAVLQVSMRAPRQRSRSLTPCSCKEGCRRGRTVSGPKRGVRTILRAAALLFGMPLCVWEADNRTFQAMSVGMFWVASCAVSVPQQPRRQASHRCAGRQNRLPSGGYFLHEYGNRSDGNGCGFASARIAQAVHALFISLAALKSCPADSWARRLYSGYPSEPNLNRVYAIGLKRTCKAGIERLRLWRGQATQTIFVPTLRNVVTLLDMA